MLKAIGRWIKSDKTKRRTRYVYIVVYYIENGNGNCNRSVGWLNLANRKRWKRLSRDINSVKERKSGGRFCVFKTIKRSLITPRLGWIFQCSYHILQLEMQTNVVFIVYCVCSKRIVCVVGIEAFRSAQMDDSIDLIVYFF